MEKSDPYASIAEFYDLEHDQFEDDLDFYVNLAKMCGGPVLELGCGSGRILKPLLKSGLKVTGLDVSAVMLQRAAEKKFLSRERSALTLFEGPMSASNAAPGGPFGVVILGLNGLMHATSSLEQRAVLSSSGNALKPGGQLLLDIVNPTPQLFQQFEQNVVHEGTWKTANGEQVDKFSSRTVALMQQHIDVQLWYDVTDRNGGLTRIHSAFTQRYVHPAELELMLELAGFVTWRFYGGYELEAFDDTSERIVVVAGR